MCLPPETAALTLRFGEGWAAELREGQCASHRICCADVEIWLERGS
jgi:hypothetical protein